uniref:Uncharacterized protein n=1 Tax=Arundo donax TaxID=35708 RepID=A0A0A9CHH1_ARUDO
MLKNWSNPFLTTCILASATRALLLNG